MHTSERQGNHARAAMNWDSPIEEVRAYAVAMVWTASFFMRCTNLLPFPSYSNDANPSETSA
jgi:hypothetical protein